MRFFLVLSLLTGLVYAQDPVNFADDTLKAAIEDELWVYDPTPTDMLDLITLTSRGSFGAPALMIRDITGLTYAINLQHLNLRLNLIDDITPLAALANLNDLNLSQNRIPDISPLSQLTGLQGLNLHANRINDLSPLRNLSNLRWLDLHYNQVKDLSPLEDLTELTFLCVHSNRITDLSTLPDLTKLQELSLDYNHVRDLSELEDMPQLIALSVCLTDLTDISSCASMPQLQMLNAGRNAIDDLSPLAFCPLLEDLRLDDNMVSDINGLTHLKQLDRLDLSQNPLNDQAYQFDLYTITQVNPRISLTYDPCRRPSSHLSATKGIHENRIHITWDTVWNGPQYTSHYRISRSALDQEIKVPISPWQTDQSFDDTTAEPGMQYRYWVQTAISPEGASAGDYSLPDTGWLFDASSVPLHSTLYVDSNAIANSNQTGSIEHPLSSIQEAIDTATDGDCIIVRPGYYFETIDFLGKNLTVTGIDPCEPNLLDFPVINGNEKDTVVHFTQGEDANCTLEGFIISRGNGAILCDRSSPTITHCLIVGNRTTDPNRGAITCRESEAWLQHCTIADNMNTGLHLVDSDVLLTNCIVWGNLPEEILVSGTSEPWIMYTNMTQPWGGLANTSVDPLFAQPGYWESDPNGVWIEGDYHLQSETGRWDPDTTLWFMDAVMSPCIDAGDPNMPWIRETEPHGSWANIGTYGNTLQASHSY